MLENDLIKLVKTIQKEKCEKQNIEIKKALSGSPSKLYDTLSSFSNQTDGGIIIFGIDELDNYNVCGVYDAQDLQKKIGEQALQMEPAVRPLFTVSSIGDKVIVSAEIAECEIFDKPCYYKGAGKLKGSYIRVGDSDVKMTEYEIYSYEAFKKRIDDELRTIKRADIDCLEKNKIADYIYKLKTHKPNLAKLALSRILETQGIIQNDLPTLCGILIFGEYPQEFFPQLSLTAMVIKGKEFADVANDEARFIDNKRFEGTISQILEDTLAFVNRNMKIKNIIDSTGKRSDIPEYPMKAIREIVLNALIHRDYSIHTERSPIRLVMYDDRLEIENPGGLYGRVTVDDLGKTSADTRNPYLAGALEIMLDTENRFSGIPTVFKELEKAGMQKPCFINQRGTFKVIIYKKEQSISEANIDNFELSILVFCKSPKSREELAEKFGFKSYSYFTKTYISPLVAKGLLKMTLPNKPKSKKQKYFS